jgi:tetratricopeptide (TPR) repeat protein
MSVAPPIRRNDACPCGSGRRYKECHGALGEATPGADLLLSRALAAHQQGRVEEAERTYREILANEPTNAIALHYLGMSTWQRGDAKAAEPLLRESIALLGTVPDFHSNLGLLLRDARRTDEAIGCFRKALEVDAGWFQAYNNLGLALEDAGRFEDAIESYRQALAREPLFPAARQNMARLLMTIGRFAEGWEEYRWRMLAQGLSTVGPRADAPRLPESLVGRRIALISEQGIGDVLFFLRFAPELAKRGAVPSFQGDVRLHPMLERTGLFPGGLAGPNGVPIGEEGTFIGDLPWLLAAREPALFPPPLALSALPERVTAMRSRLEALGPQPRIALTWRAGTTMAGPSSAQLKDLPLEALGDALRGRSATWISIQRQPREAENERIVHALGAPVHDLSGVNDDLEDMLALLSLVDEYIGVSNANTHLRAGLGGSQEVLVPFPPEWRWGARGDRSPWFPRMRVLRQSPSGDWSAALATLSR